MANKASKTEHSGAKNSTAKGGYWGYRSDAKRDSRKLRRRNGKAAAAEWEIGPYEEVLRDLCSPHLDVEAFTAVFDLVTLQTEEG